MLSVGVPRDVKYRVGVSVDSGASGALWRRGTHSDFLDSGRSPCDFSGWVEGSRVFSGREWDLVGGNGGMVPLLDCLDGWPIGWIG